jgi:GNAT superfamily N-acetyltransferase
MIEVRPLGKADYEGWRPLWDGYNAFYGRSGPTALPDEVTAATWERFLDPAEPMFANVAVENGHLVGLVHFLFHRNMTRLAPVCYLSDLFTVPEMRGRGVGRMLIESVYERARADGCRRVYWHTKVDNTVARNLYDTLATHEGFIVYTRDL